MQEKMADVLLGHLQNSDLIKKKMYALEILYVHHKFLTASFRLFIKKKIEKFTAEILQKS